ncbi:MAG: InlB B-repeat-containing protein, partial [Kiritimatiellae bacterium]|nr:InlB B-repeat-containing protein [Kiritimatiellia bacterium]
MKSLTGVAAAAMLAAFAAGKAAGRTYLVSGELCYADGARLYASDGSLSFQPVSPAGMHLFKTNAALPSYTAHPPSGRAVERWALVSLTDAAMHGSYEAASPLLEAFPGDGLVPDDGLVYSPKWKQFSANAGSFIHAAPCFKWLEYGIAFDPNTQSGGSGVDAALAMEGVAYTNTVVLPGRPSTSRWSPQYHTLLGLSTNAAATTADFEFGGRVESAGELFGATNGATVVLYGVWRADPIPVALDRGDGAVAGDTNIYAVCGQSMPPAVMPSRPGGQFKGYWYEEAVGGPVQYYGPQGESVRDWDMEYAATLKARWSPVAASVSFEDGDGAEGGSGSIEVLYGALSPDIKVPVRKGWIFDGYWSFSIGGTRYYDESGKPTTEAWTRVAPFKLYAHWRPVEYNIAYVWDGGSPGRYVQEKAAFG